MLKFLKKFLVFFKEACAIMASTRGFGFKNRNFWGIFSGQESQNLFWIALAEAVLHNLGKYACNQAWTASPIFIARGETRL
ncbi:MAG: hypothetical protein ABSA09_11110 [Desulfobaccales bacterium]|jgi:hypothetical protein